MSHFTHVSAEIRDLDACNKALNNMGLTMQSYGSCRYYFGTEMKENVVRLPGQYDMALEKNGTDSMAVLRRECISYVFLCTAGGRKNNLFKGLYPAAFERKSPACREKGRGSR